MASSHAFLARLGLEDDADERQVRRAYARELKQIDQERDLEGFQYLRACYEAALDWVAHAAAHAAHAAPVLATVDVDATGAVPSAPDDAPPGPPKQEDDAEDPVALAERVFADFRARVPALAAQPERMGQDDDARIVPWVEALRDALADPRLVHLYARVVFEHHVAALLAEGWAPGHHLLLPAAIDVFGWDQDRRALERLSHAGAVVDEALEQRAMFQSQDVLARTVQREVLFLLRQGVQPDERSLRGYAAALVALTDYFPTLLGVVAPHDLATAWRAQVTDELLREAQSAADPDVPRSWWRGGPPPGLSVAIAVFFVLRLAGLFSGHDTEPPFQGASHGFPRLEEDAAAKRERLLHPKPLYEDEPLDHERIEEIRRRIEYRPGKDVAPGEQSALFQVVLDADGSILGINPLIKVGDPAYAAAVERAIRVSGPFPPKAPKVLRIGFKIDVGGREPTRKQIDAIRRRIDYHPGKDVAPGEQHVEMDVLLNGDGAILRVNVKNPSRDPAYAAAVEQAVREGAPYPPDVPRLFWVGFTYHGDRKTPAPAAGARHGGDAAVSPASTPPSDAT